LKARIKNNQNKARKKTSLQNQRNDTHKNKNLSFDLMCANNWYNLIRTVSSMKVKYGSVIRMKLEDLNWGL
jgi:hypothetical protein